MKTCFRCRAQNQDSSRFCSNCANPFSINPDKQSEPKGNFSSNNLLIAGAILFGCLIFGAVASISHQQNQQPISYTTQEKRALQSAPPATPNATRISAIDLMQAYVDNKVRADERYEGKTLSVYGEVDTIGKDILSYPYVTLKTKEAIYSVQVYFTDRENAKLSSLDKGDRITVRGKCNGAMGNVLIKDAVIE